MDNQKNIKNVILDIGGVLVDIDEQATYDAFDRILRKDSKVDLNWENLPEVVVGMETGTWTKELFKDTMLGHCKPHVSASQMVDAWCAMLNEFPGRRVNLVKQLSEKYNVYVLSNTNVYHVSFFEIEFENRFGHNFHDLFSKVYFSNEIGCRKPNKQAFEHVLQDAGLNPAETVMVDDREDNCKGAESVGMQSILVPRDTGLEAVVKQLL